MTSLLSMETTATSSTVPTPVTRNVLTWQLSHTILNVLVKTPALGGANPTRSFSNSPGERENVPGPTLNGFREIHGTNGWSWNSLGG